MAAGRLSLQEEVASQQLEWQVVDRKANWRDAWNFEWEREIHLIGINPK